MIDCSEIRCFGFTYEEVEHIVAEYNCDLETKYTGGIVQMENKNDHNDIRYFAEALSKMRPELNISPNSISIYTEIGYIYTRREIDVIVIDGIQEER